MEQNNSTANSQRRRLLQGMAAGLLTAAVAGGEGDCRHIYAAAETARDAIGIPRDGQGVGERQPGGCQYAHRAQRYGEDGKG